MHTYDKKFIAAIEVFAISCTTWEHGYRGIQHIFESHSAFDNTFYRAESYFTQANQS